MKGYQLTFLTQQDRKHGGLSLGEWLLQEARRLGVGGATLFGASEGFGHSHRLHSAQFIDLADQPIEVTMALSEIECLRMFERLREEKIEVFYIKAPIEFGTTGKE